MLVSFSSFDVVNVRRTIESSIFCFNTLETGFNAVVAGDVQFDRLESGFEVAELGDGIFCCRQLSRCYQDTAAFKPLGDTLGNAEANASVGSGDEDDFRHGGKDLL